MVASRFSPVFILALVLIMLGVFGLESSAEAKTLAKKDMPKAKVNINMWTRSPGEYRTDKKPPTPQNLQTIDLAGLQFEEVKAFN